MVDEMHRLSRDFEVGHPVIIWPCQVLRLHKQRENRRNRLCRKWRYYGGSHKFDRYSPLDLINKSNVGKLKTAWTRPAVDASILKQFPELTPSPYFRGTPIMIGRTLYAPNGVGLIEAFDAATGETRWAQQPFGGTFKDAAGGSTRGVDYWKNGDDERIVAVKGEYLYVLDAKTGAYIPSFGEKGRVFLRRHTPDNANYQGSNGPIVVGDVIVVSGTGGGHGANDGGIYKEGAPEDVRGYDVRTGALLWTFHVLPEPGEPGHETWTDEAASFTGNMGAWVSMSADDTLGYVYIPLTAPSNSFYGGQRPGDNLYANSLVVLDAKTGKRVWHYQMVHHDLWDYDNASPPTLATLKVDGKTIDAVIQPNKTGFLFVFDRKTGAPVWPIEERAVPKSNIPGEVTSPTQPFPSKPEPFDRQGVTEADLADFTPQIKGLTREFASQYDFAPMFTPPALYKEGGKLGSLTAPSGWGSGNWNTGAFDPETGMYYAVSMTMPGATSLAKPTDPKATIAYAGQPAGMPQVTRGPYGMGPQGLPLLKPPYGRITAYNMNKGEKAWMVANGDGPRDHPLLKDLKLPPLGTIGRPVPLVTKSLLFLGESGDAVFGNGGVTGMTGFRAYDKANGKVVWQMKLPAGTTGGPVTYAIDGKQYIVLPIGGKDVGGSWVALGL